MEADVCNVDRSVGTMLSGEIARRLGAEGLPAGSIRILLRGTAGQSFGAFLVPGVCLHLEGAVNDYAGKGLCGGRIILETPKETTYEAGENVIAGNTCLYGATSGEVFFNGQAGERFAVRNSGANAVTEGLGDHGCEYMTGGHVVVLGDIGRNFGAGMTGGLAFVRALDMDSHLVNREDVTLTKVVSDEERELLHGLLRRHLEFTGSKRAGQALADWDANGDLFTKVTPAGHIPRVSVSESEDVQIGR